MDGWEKHQYELLQKAWNEGYIVEWLSSRVSKTADMTGFHMRKTVVAWFKSFIIADDIKSVMFYIPSRRMASIILKECAENTDFNCIVNDDTIVVNEKQFYFFSNVRTTRGIGVDRIILLIEDWFFTDDDSYKKNAREAFFKLFIPIISMKDTKLLIYIAQLKEGNDEEDVPRCTNVCNDVEQIYKMKFLL